MPRTGRNAKDRIQDKNMEATQHSTKAATASLIVHRYTHFRCQSLPCSVNMVQARHDSAISLLASVPCTRSLQPHFHLAQKGITLSSVLNPCSHTGPSHVHTLFSTQTSNLLTTHTSNTKRQSYSPAGPLNKCTHYKPPLQGLPTSVAQQYLCWGKACCNHLLPAVCVTTLATCSQP